MEIQIKCIIPAYYSILTKHQCSNTWWHFRETKVQIEPICNFFSSAETATLIFETAASSNPDKALLSAFTWSMLEQLLLLPQHTFQQSQFIQPTFYSIKFLAVSQSFKYPSFSPPTPKVSWRTRVFLGFLPPNVMGLRDGSCYSPPHRQLHLAEGWNFRWPASKHEFPWSQDEMFGTMCQAVFLILLLEAKRGQEKRHLGTQMAPQILEALDSPAGRTAYWSMSHPFPKHRDFQTQFWLLLAVFERKILPLALHEEFMLFSSLSA